jgi:hypothetical protein
MRWREESGARGVKEREGREETVSLRERTTMKWCGAHDR